MADAQLDHGEPDAYAAKAYLDQAKRLLDDGEVEGMSREGRSIVLHHATIAACDAVLAIDGVTIRGSEKGHSLRLAETQTRLGGELDDLFERLEDARDTRAAASYRAAPVPRQTSKPRSSL